MGRFYSNSNVYSLRSRYRADQANQMLLLLVAPTPFHRFSATMRGAWTKAVMSVLNASSVALHVQSPGRKSLGTDSSNSQLTESSRIRWAAVCPVHLASHHRPLRSSVDWLRFRQVDTWPLLWWDRSVELSGVVQAWVTYLVAYTVWHNITKSAYNWTPGMVKSGGTPCSTEDGFHMSRTSSGTDISFGTHWRRRKIM